MGIFEPIEKLNALQRVRENLAHGMGAQVIFGLSDSQKSHFLAAAVGSGPVLFVTSSDVRAERVAAELESLTGMKTAVFGGDNGILYRRRMGGAEEETARLGVLGGLRTGKIDSVVCSAEALMRPLVAATRFDERSIGPLRVGDVCPEEELTRRLSLAGYCRVPSAEEGGQFAVRGGIIDVVAPGADFGVRIELFGDEIDSIRNFAPETQRSVGSVEEASFFPARELLFTEEERVRAHALLSRHITDFFKKYNGDDAEEKKSALRTLLDGLSADGSANTEKALLPLLINEPHFLTEYFHTAPIIVLDEPKSVNERTDGAEQDLAAMCGAMLERAEALPFFADNIVPWAQTLSVLKKNGSLIAFQGFSGITPGITADAIFNVAARTVQSFYGNTEAFFREAERLVQSGSTVCVCFSTQSKAERMRQTLFENGLQGVQVAVNAIERGFEYRDIAFTVITEQDIFIKQQYTARRTHTRKNASPIRSFTELTTGDYVVHELQGIGVFRGIEQLEVSGVKRDYARIDYAGTDKLYIPAEHMDSIQRFIGTDEAPPKLNRIGGNEWNNTKARVRKSVEDLTEQLSALYAQRSVVKGYAFSPDTVWQRQFEDDFPYTETPDQLSCIADVKQDMESERVMDRLLCGDVGYGKTEVAIRAAFKAAIDGKQVAILAPTTILAQQHYLNLAERLQDYPIRCDVLSRFRTPKDQKRIIESLRDGNLDIVVGTHKLLNSNIVFKDLGLLVIDEEQRFGVKHKERIKELKKDVDVLTMTATPIPRTLNMSLTGIRDMSLISDPPENRYPVQTFVLDYSESIIRDAILRELHRGGQVFYVVTRVQGMETVTRRLSELVPEARICMAHGQMPSRELEGIIMDFYNGKFDVLVSTTIVENGIDIPMANTLIVCDADKFGLSQLYQMRGRVGRSDRIAYAYLTVRPDSAMTETAQKRLAALRDFTDLGAGFKIAMRDLEIRGAGDLMGSAQHGHMASVGYEMYCRIVADAVARIKGEPVAQRSTCETTVELSVDAFIPEDYIHSQVKRIEMYRKFAAVETQEHYSDAVDELIDRFGEPPECVMNLLDVAYVKNLASHTGIANVTRRGYDLVCTFDKNFTPKNSEEFFAALVRCGKDMSFAPKNPPVLTVRGSKNETVKSLLNRLIAFLKEV